MTSPCFFLLSVVFQRVICCLACIEEFMLCHQMCCSDTDAYTRADDCIVAIPVSYVLSLMKCKL